MVISNGLVLYRKGTAGKIVYSLEDGIDSRLRPTWRFDWDESFPKVLEFEIENGDNTSTVNLLNSSCAQWDNAVTGALQKGDKVSLKILNTGTSSYVVLFVGMIEEIEPTSGNNILLRCRDFGARAEGEKRDIIFFSNYEDREVRTVTKLEGLPGIAGITETFVAEPLVFVGYAHTDIRHVFGGGNNRAAIPMTDPDDSVAQVYTAEGDGLLGIEFDYMTQNHPSGTLTITIEQDAGDEPSGDVLITKTQAVGANDAWNTVSLDMITGGVPLATVKGQRYWCVFIQDQTSPILPGDGLSIRTQDVAAAEVIDDYKLGDAGSWGSTAGLNLMINVDQGNYVEVTANEYNFDDANNRINLISALTVESTVAAYYDQNYFRGKYSFFHGIFTLDDLMIHLIQQGTGMNEDVDANLERTLITFATLGGAIADRMREVLDLFETSGAWDGYQHVMAHYEDTGPIQKMKVGKRKKLSDASEQTISYAGDSSVVGEDIVIGTPLLKQTNRRINAKVLVIGKGADGFPLPATGIDRELSGSGGSLWEQMTGLVETTVEFDETLQTLEEVYKRMYALMDSGLRNVWEGGIPLSGIQWLMDFDSSSDTYGSGSIITLNWSPLGISSIKMKVTGITITQNSTVIRVNNKDPLRSSSLALLNMKNVGAQTDAFLSPLGTPLYVYQHYHLIDTTFSTSIVWMELQDESAVKLSGLKRVLCEVFADSDFTPTDYSLQSYRAVFGPQNGFSIDTSRVRYIKLFATPSGGSAILTVDLEASEDSIIQDLKFDKWKDQFAIIDITVSD